MLSQFWVKVLDMVNVATRKKNVIFVISIIGDNKILEAKTVGLVILTHFCQTQTLAESFTLRNACSVVKVNE